MYRVFEAQRLLSLPAAAAYQREFEQSQRAMEEMDQMQLALTLQEAARARSRKKSVRGPTKKGGKKTPAKAKALRELAELSLEELSSAGGASVVQAAAPAADAVAPDLAGLKFLQQAGLPSATATAAAAGAAAGGVLAQDGVSPAGARGTDAAVAAPGTQAWIQSRDAAVEAPAIVSRAEADAGPPQIRGREAPATIASLVDLFLTSSAEEIGGINLLTDEVRQALGAVDPSQSDPEAVAAEIARMEATAQPALDETNACKNAHLALLRQLNEVPFLVGAEREEATRQLAVIRNTICRSMYRVFEAQRLLSLPAAAAYQREFEQSQRANDEMDQMQLALALQEATRARSRKKSVRGPTKKGGKKTPAAAKALRELAELSSSRDE
jgi:hypothetical protein